MQLDACCWLSLFAFLYRLSQVSTMPLLLNLSGILLTTESLLLLLSGFNSAVWIRVAAPVVAVVREGNVQVNKRKTTMNGVKVVVLML